MTTTTMPRAAQRDSALCRAREVRRKRGELKRALKRGELSLEAALREDALQTMPVTDVLAYLPYRSDAKASGRTLERARYGPAQILVAAKIAPNRAVAALTDAQRERLLDTAERLRPQLVVRDDH